jgi:hypothetical protein
VLDKWLVKRISLYSSNLRKRRIKQVSREFRYLSVALFEASFSGGITPEQQPENGLHCQGTLVFLLFSVKITIFFLSNGKSGFCWRKSGFLSPFRHVLNGFK